MNRTWKLLTLIVILIGFLAGGIFFILPTISSSAEFVSEFGAKKELKSSEGRTNILIIGVDKRDDKYLQTGNLTDTMIIASIDPVAKDVKLLSLPRDLWVVVDGRGSKINEVLAVGGLENLKSTLERVLGLKIHYTAKIDFTAFESLIDTLGGIDINNPIAFTDYYYPKFGWENEECGVDVEKLKKEKLEKLKKENRNARMEDVTLSDYDFPCRFEVISFPAGKITLNGERALKYARSRHSPDGNQGSDFARAKRQHLIIFGLINKALNLGVITNPAKIRELYLSLTRTVETDFSVNELMLSLPLIPEARNFKFSSEVLQAGNPSDPGSVLVQGDPNEYNSLYVLVPKQPSSIINFVNEYLYTRSTEGLTKGL